MRQSEEALTAPQIDHPDDAESVARLPGILKATRAGAVAAVGALQTLPDQTLRSPAATSVGVGIGLSFTRARRLAIVAGMVPAVLMGTAIVMRPLQSGIPAEAAG